MVHILLQSAQRITGWRWLLICIDCVARLWPVSGRLCLEGKHCLILYEAERKWHERLKIHGHVGGTSSPFLMAT